MKKILSLVLVLSMVLGSFGFAFANEEAAGMERVVEAGAFGVGGLRLEDVATRAELATIVLRLSGYTDEEIVALNETADYEDVSEDDWFAPFVGLATKEGLFGGYGNGYFGPTDEANYAQLLTVMLRALGYGDELADLAWPNGFLVKAAAVGIPVDFSIDPLAPATREVVGTTMEQSLDVALNGEEMTLAGKLGIEPVEVPVEEPVVTALEVVDVYADNLKEVVVVFNQEVSEETVVDGNFSLNKDKKISTAMLQEDGMTVVLTVQDKLDNQVEYELTVDKVENLAEEAMEKAEVPFEAFDGVLPDVEELVITGPRTFEIKFTEPVTDVADQKVVVKQDKTTLGNKVTVDGTEVVKVEVFTKFVDGKTYTAKISGFEDFAGYANIIRTAEFNYEEDNTPPIAEVTKVEQTYVIVEFNKPVSGLEKASFYHTFNAWKSIGIYSDADMTDAITTKEAVSKAYVKFHGLDNAGDEIVGSRAIPEGETVFGIFGDDIEDNWGNELGDQTFDISVAADKTTPEVTEIKVVAEDKLEVKFSKEVIFENKNIEVLDEDGEEIDGVTVNVLDAGKGKTFEVELGKKLSGEIITVTIEDVKDTTLKENELNLYTELIEVTDKTKPEVKEVYYNIEFDKVDDGDNTFKTKELYVRFSEEVDADTALKASNYAIVFDGADVTILTEDPSFDGVNTRVKLPLTDAQADIIWEEQKLDPTLLKIKLQVINVEDLAENAIKPKLVSLNTDIQTEQFVKVESIEATAKDTLVVKFNDLLSGVTSDAFLVNGGNNFTLTQTEEKGATVLEFVYGSKAFETDKDNVTFEVLFGQGLKNSFGTIILSLDNDPTTEVTQDATSAEFYNSFIKDEITPEIVKYDAGDNKDKYKVERTDASTIKIYFSEQIDKDALSTITFKVEKAKVDMIDTEAGGTVVVLTISQSGTDAIPAAPKVTQENDVIDMSGNTFMAEKALQSIVPTP
ncbi:hypothetical protein F8154_08490 [Alkaliphilus pronyensis]|uniref:SLH domain-containing protein n=1 Tax=Alkaliphilus pronyensis TaxID=1482732 RepID=A0A6I0FFL5_9FIRM|nr:S-layer homology domain-containing protein [Alkaliphilus pronyensis]KAB3534751.1 hypothetical protein F8154_08490 [Alkaliphilus pronyensis]